MPPARAVQDGRLRAPAVAGQFYPGRERELAREVERSFRAAAPPVAGVVGVVMPHAGYVYSGAVAGETIARVEVPGRVVVLGPNHTGMGAPISLFPGGRWEMPFGEVPVDDELLGLLAEELPHAEMDTGAHLREHSIEVQLPFLWYRAIGQGPAEPARGPRSGGIPPFLLSPVVLSHLPARLCREAGQALARAVTRVGEPVLIVASSDMNHYESEAVTQKKDLAALSPLLQLDPDGLLDTVARGDISMCGAIPAAVMLHAALALGASKAALVRHTTSGETSGDYDHVVGYAGVIISR